MLLYTSCILSLYQLHITSIPAAYYLYTSCILPVYQLHIICIQLHIICIPAAYYLYTSCILSVYQLHITCIPAAYYLYTICILPVYQLHIICIPAAYYLYNSCILSVPAIFKALICTLQSLMDDDGSNTTLLMDLQPSQVTVAPLKGDAPLPADGKRRPAQPPKPQSLPKPLVPSVLEPLVPEPALPKPLVPESALPKPLVPEPASSKPLVLEPALPKPLVPEPASSKPLVLEPALPEPLVPEPVVAQNTEVMVLKCYWEVSSFNPVYTAYWCPYIGWVCGLDSCRYPVCVVPANVEPIHVQGSGVECTAGVYFVVAV